MGKQPGTQSKAENGSPGNDELNQGQNIFWKVACFHFSLLQTGLDASVNNDRKTLSTGSLSRQKKNLNVFLLKERFPFSLWLGVQRCYLGGQMADFC